MRSDWRTAALTVLVLSLALAGATRAEVPGPLPPCADVAVSYPPPEAPPAVTLWDGDKLAAEGWTPPACTDWPASAQSRQVMTVAGSFRFGGTLDDLLTRIGAASARQHIRFWSVTLKRWRPFATDSFALADADPQHRRGDFAPAELTPGSTLYYLDRGPSGDLVFRMTVLDRRPTRAVIGNDNVSRVPFLMVTLFPPGALQTVQFIERIGPGLWGVYLLSRVDRSANLLATSMDAPYVNRAVALYRYLIGVPTDQEPPPMR